MFNEYTNKITVDITIYDNKCLQLFPLFLQPLSMRTKLRRLKWTEHICRLDGSRSPREILEVNKYGSRNVGKPKNRKIKAVSRDASKLLGIVGWKRVTLHRKIWGTKIEEVKARD
jgi:hypothetical protein